jgi:tetratricopeptide (TPR) repeat protein
MPRAAVLLVAVLALAAPAARADENRPASDENVATATRRYEAGMAHFNLEEWDQAIVDFEAGYRAKPVPEFLYNLGQAYRLSRRPEKAIGFYRRFLYTLPAEATNRAEVERQIATCEHDIAAHKNEPSTVTTPANGTAPPASSLVAVAPRKTPLTKKRWFWGVIGGAAAVVVGAVVIGAVVGTRDGQQQLPGVRF